MKATTIAAPAFTRNSWYDALLAERRADRARFETRYSLATQAAVEAHARAQAQATRPTRGGNL